MITRTDVAAHMEHGVRTGFLNGLNSYNPLRAAFVDEMPSDGAFETYADMGDPPWPVQNAGQEGAGGTDGRTGAPAVNRMNAGGPITVVGGEERSLVVYNVDWDITIGVEHNALDDGRVGSLEVWSRNAGINFQKFLDYKAFHALNSGEAVTNYGAGYDGLSFFNAAHIDPRAAYQTAQSNALTLGLSLDNFEAVKVAASKFRDSRGQPVGMNHNLLIVPPDLERIAAQITGNQQAYDTANREINPYSGSTSHLVAPGGWLDTTAWFVVDRSQGRKPIGLQMRKFPAELVIWDDETQGGGTRYYKWHARGAIFYGDWRLCVQGNS